MYDHVHIHINTCTYSYTFTYTHITYTHKSHIYIYIYELHTHLIWFESRQIPMNPGLHALQAEVYTPVISKENSRICQEGMGSYSKKKQSSWFVLVHFALRHFPEVRHIWILFSCALGLPFWRGYGCIHVSRKCSVQRLLQDVRVLNMKWAGRDGSRTLSRGTAGPGAEK
jgi:hypothetical protein